jgi:hypothetical protein
MITERSDVIILVARKRSGSEADVATSFEENRVIKD